VKFVKGKPLGKTWKKVIEEQLMKHGARLARVEITAGRQRDAERVTVRVKKIVENVVPDPGTTSRLPWDFRAQREARPDPLRSGSIAFILPANRAVSPEFVQLVNYGSGSALKVPS